jgi:hypothetical protein
MLIRCRFRFFYLVNLLEKVVEEKRSNLCRAGFTGVDGNQNEVTRAKV